jgi:hypothetical protein
MRKRLVDRIPFAKIVIGAGGGIYPLAGIVRAVILLTSRRYSAVGGGAG